MRDHTPDALRAAKRLRAEMSLPVAVLRRLLRAQPTGVAARHQPPIGKYAADFNCAGRGLIVEIDGMAHDMGQRPTRDARRDERPRDHGMEVTGFPATDGLRDPEDVAASGASRLSPRPSGEDRHR